MPEIISQQPINRHVTEFINDDGTKSYKCKTLQNPDYYFDGEFYNDIDVVSKLSTESTIGDISLVDRNIVSVGIRKDGDKNKLYGFRPDEKQDGSEQFEVSVDSVLFDNEEQTLDFSNQSTYNDVTTKLGDIFYLQRARQRCRALVKATNKISSFKISFRLNLTGLKIVQKSDEYWVYNEADEFRFKLGKPYLVDTEKLQPLMKDIVIPYDNMVKHSLVETETKGEYIYIKESTDTFGKIELPEEYFIDADTVYTSTADAFVQLGNSTWAGARGGATGDYLTATSDPNSTLGFLMSSTYYVRRTFNYYSLSGLSGIVTDVTENLYGVGNSGSEEVCVQKGTQASPLAAADFDSFTGTYYAKVTWGTGAYKVFTYPAQGKSDVEAVLGGTFKTCIRNYTKDYLNSTPTGMPFQEFSSAEHTGTSQDPYLYVTLFTPNAPTEVSATDNLTNKVTVTWRAGAGGWDGHRVYRDGSDVSGVVAATNGSGETIAVTDPGLETWTSSSVLTNWTYYQDGTGGSLAREATIKKNGTYSAKITFAGTGTGCLIYQNTAINVTRYRGKKISVGVWCKSANTVADKVRLTIYTDALTALNWDYYSNSGDWEYLVTYLTVPADGTNFYIQLREESGADAPAYYDDVSCIEGQAEWDGANGLRIPLYTYNDVPLVGTYSYTVKAINAGQLSAASSADIGKMKYSAIDIGYGAVTLASHGNFLDYTYFVTNNPANATGVLNSFEFYTAADSPNTKAGTFYASGAFFANRDYESIGTVTGGSKQTFTGKNCNVVTGDFYGMRHNGGDAYYTTTGGSGTDRWYNCAGDQFGTGNQAYKASPTGYLMSGYATGVTLPDEPTSVSATDNLSDKVIITWTAGAGETGGHRVYRDGADISGIVAHGTSTYSDTSGTQGTTYSYTVKAINDAGLSYVSNADNGLRRYSAIDIGSAAVNGSDDFGWAGYSGLFLTNPANATGVLTSFEAYVSAECTSVKLGTASGSGTSYTGRDYESVGTITAGSKQTFTGKNCTVVTGDYMAFYIGGGTATVDATAGAIASYYYLGDVFNYTRTFTLGLNQSWSFYATGVTIPNPPTNVSATDDLTNKITITWTAGTEETDGHRVYRDGADVSGVVAHGTATFDDVPDAGTYSYTVKAINPAGLSEASTADNGTRIAGSATITSTVTAKVRIKFTDTTKTITAKTRIKITDITKTVTCKVNIKFNITETTTAKIRIVATINRPLSSKVRILVGSSSFNIDAKTRIKQIVSATLSAKTRIKTLSETTITTKVRINKTDNESTLSSKVRINLIQESTLESKTRIKTTQNMSVSSMLRIQVGSVVDTIDSRVDIAKFDNDKTATSKVRINKIEETILDTIVRIKIVGIDNTTESVVRINKNINESVTAVVRIKVLVGNELSSVVRIKNEYESTLSSKVNVKNTNYSTETSKVRINIAGNNASVSSKVDIKQLDVTSDIESKVRIKTLETEIISALLRIKNTFLSTIEAKVYILKIGYNPVSTKVRILKTESTSISSKVRIFINNVVTVSAKVRIETLGSNNISAKVNILPSLVTIDKTVTSLVRIQIINITNEVSAKTRILLVSSLDINSKVRIFVNQNESLSAKVRIITNFTRTLSSLVRVQIIDTAKTVSSKINIKTVSDITISSKVKIVYTGLAMLISPIHYTVVIGGTTYLVWRIPQDYIGRNLHFRVILDDDNADFISLEKDLYSYRDSGFEYYNGASWVEFPAEGVDNIYAGQNARVLVENLSVNSTKYWKVRTEIK